MGPHFGKFQAMESIWEEKLMLSIMWESYGDRMSIEIPYHDTFVCPMPYMELIWDVHTLKSHMFSIPADSNFFNCIELPYD